MPLFDRIAGGYRALRADTSAGTEADGSAILSDRYFGGMYSSVFGAGMRITPETAKTDATVQACVNFIARTIGAMPCKVLEETVGGRRVAKECPEYNLLHRRPNDRQTAIEFRQMMQGHFELWGNAYAEIKRDRRGNVVQLLAMHPSRVIPEILTNGRMRYKYSDPLTNGTRYLVQEEVFHLRNWSDDGYVGQSTVAMNKDVFGVALAMQDYTANFFKNDSRPSGYFYREDGAQKFRSTEESDQFTANYAKGVTGANRHKMPVLPAGWKIGTIAVKPNESQLLEAQKFARIRICSVFGVPPHIVGETEKAATYASVEQFQIMCATQCILPRVIVWEQAISRDILQEDSLSARFSMAAMLRGDNGSRTAAYAVAIQNGWLSQNDVRLLEDMDPIPDGDTYWRSLALAPLGQIDPPADGAGTGKSATTAEESKLLKDETRRNAQSPPPGIAADLLHNTHLLGAMANKSPAEVTAALQEMR